MIFLRTILNFGIGLAGGKVQLAVWAVVIIGGGIFIANHQRGVKERAMLEQRNFDLEQRAKGAEAAYAEAVADLDLERAKVATLKDSQAKERTALAGVRSQISAGLAEGLGNIASKGQSIETDTRSIPASELDTRIRQAIQRARAADVELARIRASQ